MEPTTTTTTTRAVRSIEPGEEVRRYLAGMRLAFLAVKDVDDDAVAWFEARADLDRTWIAVDDDGTQCGTARTFASRLRLPGLADVAVSCLTQVTVLPTHTRRGHLTAMMRTQLDAAVDAGEVASLLLAAEWPIYGRFGYGPATQWCEWEVDSLQATVAAPPVGRCRWVEPAAFAEAMTTVLARQQATTPGSIVRLPYVIAWLAGVDRRPDDDMKPGEMVRVVHVDDDGVPDGFVSYAVKDESDGMRAVATITVKDLVAADRVAERELWRYLVDVDITTKVVWGGSPSSVIRHALTDGRAARVEGLWDHLWARILDVPGALTARSYASSGHVVVDVVDPFLDRGGRFVLDAGPDGATCEPTTAAADVTLPVGALGAAWLGSTDLRTVAAGGAAAVVEHADGAVDRLATLLRWPGDVYCSTDF